MKGETARFGARRITKGILFGLSTTRFSLILQRRNLQSSPHGMTRPSPWRTVVKFREGRGWDDVETSREKADRESTKSRKREAKVISFRRSSGVITGQIR
eukprot:GFKZ01001452.1.p4 GENE.GFKZ01001452.1~~GFKZ01001452.1.p4  ORF type:complete len:100 (-),score=9.52 GFKZ01001452.1:52-351(-)